MSRTRWKDRDPEWTDSNGKPVYDRKAKVRIWSEKLKAEYFPPPRKPTYAQRLQIASAVCLALELSDMHLAFQEGKPLPKDFLPKLNTLQRLLESWRPKAPRGKKTPAKDSGLGLAAILGGEA